MNNKYQDYQSLGKNGAVRAILAANNSNKLSVATRLIEMLHASRKKSKEASAS